MKSRKKSKRSKARPSSGGKLHLMLVLAGAGLMGWLWWNQSGSPWPVKLPGWERSKPADPSASRSGQKPSPLASNSPAKSASPTVSAPGWSWSQPPPTEIIPKPPLALPSEAGPKLPFTAPPTVVLPLAPTNPPSPPEGVKSRPPTNTAAVREAAAPAASPAEKFRSIWEGQLSLVRKGISPGSLDGVMGSQTRTALRVFQEKERIPATGEFDVLTRERLLTSEAAQVTYGIASGDLAQLGPVGRTWLAKSNQERLNHETLLELLSEKSFAHPELLRKLNPGFNWSAAKPGDQVTLPNSQYPPVRVKAGFVRINLTRRTLQAFDPSTNLLVHFPCSIARLMEKRPVGLLFVETIALAPNYRFDPAIFRDSAEARQLGRPLMIPPGPNNPVGAAWIGLNRSGYGIHGTPHPEDVGRTESHGCFRLANWNAEYLALLVKIGTPVWVEM